MKKVVCSECYYYDWDNCRHPKNLEIKYTHRDKEHISVYTAKELNKNNNCKLYQNIYFKFHMILLLGLCLFGVVFICSHLRSL